MLDSVHRRADSTQPFCGAVDILLLVIVCVEKVHKSDDVLRIMMSLLSAYFRFILERWSETAGRFLTIRDALHSEISVPRN